MLRSCLADPTSGHLGILTSAEEQALYVEKLPCDPTSGHLGTLTSAEEQALCVEKLPC